MPGFTVPLGFPYPLPGDPTNGPANIQDLAEAIDAAVTATETQLANISDPPIAWVGAAPAAIPNALGTPLQFTVQFYDNADMVDLVTSNTNIVIRSAGLYMLSGEVGFEPNGTPGKQLEIVVNGTAIAVSASAPPTATNFGWSCNASVMRVMAVNDIVTFRAGHTSGITITTTGAEAEVFRVSA